MAVLEWSAAGSPGGHAQPGGGRGYGTRLARGWGGVHLASRDRASVGYRVPSEWASLTDAQRGIGSLAGFKGGPGMGIFNSVWNAYHKLKGELPRIVSFKNGAVLVFFSGLLLKCVFIENPRNTSCDNASCILCS